MRSTVRLVLSYVVVVTGCSTPSVEAPAPTRYPGGVVQQGAPARGAAARPIRFARARAGDADTLFVRVQGPTSVSSPSAPEFTAVVENGRANRYYYWWFVASCAKGAGCIPSSYQLLGEGEERTTVDVPFGAMHAEKDIVVQVAEIDGEGQTGSSAQFAVAGPAPRRSQKREGVSGGICDWFAGIFYPHKGMYTDPFTGRTWERGFRRDYCGNRVSWQPGQ